MPLAGPRIFKMEYRICDVSVTLQQFSKLLILRGVFCEGLTDTKHASIEKFRALKIRYKESCSH